MAAPLYLLVVLLPSVLGQCTEEKAAPLLSRSVYEFSVDLIQRLGHDTGNHFVASPLSLWTLLSSISAGADGKTLTEINKTLRRNPVPCYNKKYLEIVKKIIPTRPIASLERSSAIFVDNAMPVHENFQRKLTTSGVCDIQILNFENFKTVASTINDYVSRGTHCKIQRVVTESDIEGVYLMLIDAIYFNGAWSYPFQPSRTEPATMFYGEGDIHSGYVRMMHGEAPIRTGDFSQIQANVLELPYTDPDRSSMLIFVPYSNSSVSTVMGLLKRVTIRSILMGMTDMVSVNMPRFNIKTDLNNLKDLLTEMGLKTMFNSTQADFPDISAYQLYVSNVLQRAAIGVAEGGTASAVASAAEMQSRRSRGTFAVNKPFLFMIVNTEFNLPLLIGAYSKSSYME